ncbi:hypothetical protein [Scytonema sp. NUACC26]|uniref:hypothetical protein n=1 Tax=Scytonema sp. NUACC26 TaxID=3140176 RepID=UPI0034DBFAAE
MKTRINRQFRLAAHPGWSEAIRDIGQWLDQGKIKYAIEIVEGLENAPLAVLKLFNGNKKGKLLVKVSEEPT